MKNNNRKFAVYNNNTKSYQIIIPPHLEAFALSNVSNQEQCKQFNRAQGNKENEITVAFMCFASGEWSQFNNLMNQTKEDEDKITNEVK